MSIDTKEDLERRIADSLACGKHLAAAEYITLLAQEVIADELPNITKAVLNHPLDKLGDLIEGETFAEALAEQPVAAGDVPEWLTDYEGKSIDGFDTQAIWDAFQSEISRRVAEVSADRDKWIERAGEHAKTIGEQAKRIAFLDEQCSLNLKAYHEMTKDRDSWQTLHDRRTNELNAEMDAKEATQKQLAAAQAEVARLQSEIVGNLKVVPGAIRVREGGADEDVAKSLAVSVAKLVDENKRLTRPVEGVNWERLGAEMEQWLHNPARGCNRDYLKRVFEPLLQSERNAREAAEAERDELREFVKAKYFWQSDDRLTKKVCTDNRHWPVTNEDIDKGLSAYRAEKGKVPQ